MLPRIAERRSEIADICRRFGVRRLAVFGSRRGERTSTRPAAILISSSNSIPSKRRR
jgi:predicted nucleotidyltransferase